MAISPAKYNWQVTTKQCCSTTTPTPPGQANLRPHLNTTLPTKYPSNLTDINYRTFYGPLALQSRLPNRIKYMQLTESWGRWDQFHFKWVDGKDFDPTHRRYYEWVHTRIFSQIMNHVRSLEFSAGLNIPHDFMIQAMVLQIHFWMVINRLKQIGS